MVWNWTDCDEMGWDGTGCDGVEEQDGLWWNGTGCDGMGRTVIGWGEMGGTRLTVARCFRPPIISASFEPKTRSPTTRSSKREQSSARPKGDAVPAMGWWEDRTPRAESCIHNASASRSRLLTLSLMLTKESTVWHTIHVQRMMHIENNAAHSYTKTSKDRSWERFNGTPPLVTHFKWCIYTF